MQKLLHITVFISFLQGLLVAQSRFLFVENKGQWPEEFNYKCDLPGGAMFIEPGVITWHFVDRSAMHHAHTSPMVNKQHMIRGHAFKTLFINANKEAHHFSTEPVKYYLNYFLGNDPENWVSELYPKQKIYYQNLWNQIDLHFYNASGRLKYDFIVHPGGDIADLRWKYDGVSEAKIKDGHLIIKTSLGTVTEQKPYAYQMVHGDKKEIYCRYIQQPNGEFTFEVGKYNRNLPLVIDPTLIFSSFTGSTADNFGMTATYDSQGHFYTGGMAYNVGYPVTVGAYQTTTNLNGSTYGVTDVVITKFTPDGSNLVYSTYLGGGTATSGTETVHSLIVNENDELYMFGVTSSSDFPTTSGAYDQTFNGGSFIGFMQNGTYFHSGTDIYVSKFNATGTSLLASTFIGGSGNDGVNYNHNYLSAGNWISNYDSLQFNYGDQFRGEIMLDAAGNCYVATTTKSSDFPVVNALQPSFGGIQDAVIFKFDPNLQNLIFSTYLGGNNKDAAYGIKVDQNNDVYVVGGTASADFPTTAGVINTAFQSGNADGFVAKIDASGNALVSSTYIGTNDYDQLFFIDLDVDNDVYVFGQTKNPGGYSSFNANYFNNNSGQFVSKFNNSLTTVIYNSQIGNGNGQVNISPTAFLVDICENVYISGWGGSLISGNPLTGLPVTPNALQSSSGDGYNFYVAVYAANFDSLVYATYFGGPQSREHVDGGTSRFDKNGVIYQSVCAGCGGYDDFPTTPGAWSQNNNSTNCNNGVFKLSIEMPIVNANFDFPSAVCAGLTYQFQSNASNTLLHQWYFGDGDSSNVPNPLHTFPYPGLYNVTLIVTDTTLSSCITSDTITKQITIVDSPGNPDLAQIDVCQSSSVQIGIPPQPGYTYTWIPATGLSNPTISNPIASPPVTTDYMLIIDNGFCVDTVYQTVQVDDVIPVPGFGFIPSGSCGGVSVALQNFATNQTNTIFIINGDTLAPGDTIFNVAFNNSVNVTQVVFNGACTASLTQTFTAGGFGDYNPDSLIMPNVFTPTVSPGLNDLFCPVNANGAYCYKMYIYNRWGILVYESGANNPCWDGHVKDSGNLAVDGVYFWILEYAGEKQHGFVHLIRH